MSMSSGLKNISKNLSEPTEGKKSLLRQLALPAAIALGLGASAFGVKKMFFKPKINAAETDRLVNLLADKVRKAIG